MAFPLKFDKLSLAKCAAESMVYLEKHKLLEILTQLFAEISIVRPENPREWIGKNVVRIADGIYKNCLKLSYEGSGECTFFQLPRRFHHRVVIFGRRGSGRRSQAASLAKQFNLVIVDADRLLQRHLLEKDELSKKLQATFHGEDVVAKSQFLCKIISDRLLQSDCLQKGWILLNFPNNVEECKELFEKFTIPPNKFVYLQCEEKMAVQRAVTKPNLGCPQDMISFIEREMEHFNANEKDMTEYLNRRHEVIWINSTPRFDVVRTEMLMKLERVPYVMGFKQQ